MNNGDLKRLLSVVLPQLLDDAITNGSIPRWDSPLPDLLVPTLLTSVFAPQYKPELQRRIADKYAIENVLALIGVAWIFRQKGKLFKLDSIDETRLKVTTGEELNLYLQEIHCTPLMLSTTPSASTTTPDSTAHLDLAEKVALMSGFVHPNTVATFYTAQPSEQLALKVLAVHLCKHPYVLSAFKDEHTAHLVAYANTLRWIARLPLEQVRPYVRPTDFADMVGKIPFATLQTMLPPYTCLPSNLAQKLAVAIGWSAEKVKNINTSTPVVLGQLAVDIKNAYSLSLKHPEQRDELTYMSALLKAHDAGLPLPCPVEFRRSLVQSEIGKQPSASVETPKSVPSDPVPVTSDYVVPDMAHRIAAKLGLIELTSTRTFYSLYPDEQHALKAIAGMFDNKTTYDRLVGDLNQWEKGYVDELVFIYRHPKRPFTSVDTYTAFRHHHEMDGGDGDITFYSFDTSYTDRNAIQVTQIKVGMNVAFILKTQSDIIEGEVVSTVGKLTFVLNNNQTYFYGRVEKAWEISVVTLDRSWENNTPKAAPVIEPRVETVAPVIEPRVETVAPSAPVGSFFAKIKTPVAPIEVVPDPTNEAVPEPTNEAVPEPINEAVPEVINEAVPDVIKEVDDETVPLAVNVDFWKYIDPGYVPTSSADNEEMLHARKLHAQMFAGSTEPGMVDVNPDDPNDAFPNITDEAVPEVISLATPALFNALLENSDLQRVVSGLVKVSGQHQSILTVLTNPVLREAATDIITAVATALTSVSTILRDPEVQHALTALKEQMKELNDVDA